jgi:hypothetical protein
MVNVIKAPNIQTRTYRLMGNAPLVVHRFSKKLELMEKHKAGSAGKNKKQKEPRDFDKDAEAAKHVSSSGWLGFPASAIRSACVSACRVAGYQMTKAKLSIFVVSEGIDRDEGIPLIQIHGECEHVQHTTRNETGVADVRSRPMWREWHSVVAIRFDGDQFTSADVLNLLQRAGLQVGIGEGRPDSKKSCGMGWGTFDAAEEVAG